MLLATESLDILLAFIEQDVPLKPLQVVDWRRRFQPSET